MAEEVRTTKPTGGPAMPGQKGAHVEGQMGPPHSPSGPNEVDGDPSGVMPPPVQVPPGEDQVGLVGGDPGEAITSQTGNPNWPTAEEAQKREQEAIDARDAANAKAKAAPKATPAHDPGKTSLGRK